MQPLRVATPAYQWKITKKSLKLKKFPLRLGQRCHAWISVEFEETDPATGKSETHKIEGYLKPVVQSPSS